MGDINIIQMIECSDWTNKRFLWNNKWNSINLKEFQLFGISEQLNSKIREINDRRNKMQKNENNIIIYQDEDGVTKVSVKFANEDIWLTQNQIAEIYETTQQNISLHINNIYIKIEN